MNKSMECVAYLFAPEGLEKLDFGIVTMVNFAFAIPTDQGHVLPLENPALARAVVEKAHAAGSKSGPVPGRLELAGEGPGAHLPGCYGHPRKAAAAGK